MEADRGFGTIYQRTMNERNPAQYFAEHPRMVGALFTVLLLLTTVQPVAAGGVVSHYGP